MLIKKADDKSDRVALLQGLTERPGVPARAREWARDELMRFQRGIQGERDAAFYLDNYLRDDPDRMLIHDLRLVIDGEVAQIDHLMLTRGPVVYLLETKCFNGEVRINGSGEFSVRYGEGREYGIESPIEQSRRHEGPLLRLMKRLGITGRTGNAPRVRHAVLIHPKATVHRPAPRYFDSSAVIKADQFRSWHELQTEQVGLTEALMIGLTMRSADTVREFAEKLARQHRKPDLLALPDYVQEWLATPAPSKAASVAAPVPTKPAAPAAESQKRLICVECGQKISFPEGKFCWNNPQRFGGVQYCRAHQATR